MPSSSDEGKKVTKKVNSDGSVITTTTTETHHERGEKVSTLETKTAVTKPLEQKASKKDKSALKSFPEKMRDKLPSNKSSKKSANGGRGDFIKDCLEAHNKVRKEHAAEPLKLNKEMNKYSEDWAQKLAERDVMEHGPNKDYGENIYSVWSNDPDFTISGAEAVERWYKEAEEHKFDEEPNENKTGHFTQIVWKDTKELGVGVAKSKSNKIYLVLTYYPPGNIVGQFQKNVHPSEHKEPNRAKAFLKSLIKRDSSNSSDSGSSDDEESAQKKLNERAVKLHNEHRQKHGVPPLKESDKLQRYAKRWAKKLAAADELKHRPDGKYGENIFCLRTNDPKYKVSAKDFCDSWYGEIKDHDFTKEPDSNFKSGHFSQMIWKSSEEFGCAMAKSESGRIIVVANYKPAGNVIGEFKNNVPKAK